MLRFLDSLANLQEKGMFRVILASKSPRRLGILKENIFGEKIKVEVMPSSFVEDWPKDKSPEEYTEAYAREKAKCIETAIIKKTGLGPSICAIIGSDTVISSAGKILEKPKDSGEAIEMLLSYRGESHHVITGVQITLLVFEDENGHQTVSQTSHSFSCKTMVKFANFAYDDIVAYVGTGEPMDKAGGYGIQGLGAFLCESIDGSYSNVVGLPARQVAVSLASLIEPNLKKKCFTLPEEAAESEDTSGGDGHLKKLKASA